MARIINPIPDYMKWWQSLSHTEKLFYNNNKDYKKLTVRQVQIIYHRYKV